ncbi:matrix metalloproteinase-C-like [Topomyia yanbarensis]|uniref:matrix metalloproteinase-C-like n=1 Tax=Topomyia yanbarensis TaxID=2498891 RepID=UPI00273C1D09|nr:matrix metalloproteinase-C-like [Topomyia yanbarensis]
MMLLVILVLFGISERYYCAPFYIDPDTIIKPEHVQRDDLERGDEVTAPVDPRPPPEISNQEAQEVLNELGFLDGMNSSYDVLTRLDHTKDDAVATALRKFQRRYQLPESGLLDDDTKRLLAAPRCGLAELNIVQDRWTKQLLTYRIRSFPKSLEPAMARQLIRSAFEQWNQQVLSNTSNEP